MNKPWMIYGANGYTGALIAREAVKNAERPILGGRSEVSLRALAEELDLEHRTFGVDRASQSLMDVSAVLNCAGPFSATVKPLVEACLKHRVHYIDITGEIPVFRFCYSQDTRAKRAGIILCPGAGFDVVPTDCLAAILKECLPDATNINLAFSSSSRLSHGTAKTLIESFGTGGMICRRHKVISVPSGYRIRRIAFSKGQRWAVTIPWGDVFTAGISTGVPNVMVYTAAPLLAGIALRAVNPLRRIVALSIVRTCLRRVVDRGFAGGPDEASRRRKRADVWGEASNERGERVVARLTTPNPYALSADTALATLLHCISLDGVAGYFTPSALLGSRFILSRQGVEYEPPWQEDSLV